MNENDRLLEDLKVIRDKLEMEGLWTQVNVIESAIEEIQKLREICEKNKYNGDKVIQDSM